jgi:purine-binding chemotaxis protein CheW
MKIDTVKLVTFRLGDDLFAADIYSVERVIRYSMPSVVPGVPDWIEGVLEYQSRVIPIVDMRRRVELPSAIEDPDMRILILNTSSGWIGAVVDAVIEVAMVPATLVSPPPPLFRGLSAQFVRGIAKVGDRLVVVLEMDKILTSEEHIVLERAFAEVAGRG